MLTLSKQTKILLCATIFVTNGSVGAGWNTNGTSAAAPHGHARRKFNDALKLNTEAQEMIDLIAKLYKVEKETQSVSSEKTPRSAIE